MTISALQYLSAECREAALLGGLFAGCLSHDHPAVQREGVEIERKTLAVAGLPGDADVSPSGIIPIAGNAVEPVGGTVAGVGIGHSLAPFVMAAG